MHKPIILNNISLSFATKTCFEEFNATIYPGSRIAIIGRNGSGKSSLLNIIRGALQPSSGEINIPEDLNVGFVEQTIAEFNNLSGGQRFNKRLSEVLSQCPALLLLDEPTNHLDTDNRKSLMQKLRKYQGSFVVVSHDTELLRHCVDTLWHIDDKKIHIFTGCYDDYIREIQQKRALIEKELTALKQQKKETHLALMKEQKRAATSKKKGKKNISQKKWPTVVSGAKALRAEQTSGKKKLAIANKKQVLLEKLSECKMPEIILPKFSLSADNIKNSNILSINTTSIRYEAERVILENVSLSLNGKERIAICGKNGSGKSTLLKAILAKDEVFTTGNLYLPRNEHIGYLDQHYSNLQPTLSVIEHLKALRPEWTEIEARRHLNDFLFRKNEEVMQLCGALSGGEKARASLSLIAAKTPRLLILDEITNNLDLETKAHVVQILKAYPGAMIVVSHEEDFLQAIAIDRVYSIEAGKVFCI